MVTLLLTRHPATMSWLKAQAEQRGWHPVMAIEHIQATLPANVERVVGVYPVALAAKWAREGIETWHVQLSLAGNERGVELDAAQFERCQPVLRRIKVIEMGDEE